MKTKPIVDKIIPLIDADDGDGVIKLLSPLSAEEKIAVIKATTRSRYYFHNLKKMKMLLSVCPEKERIDLISSTFLMQTRGSDFFYLLNEIPVEQRSKALLYQNRLRGIIAFPKSIDFETVASYISKEDIRNALLNDKMLLTIAARHNIKAFKFLLPLIPKEERLKAILERDESGKSVFELASVQAREFILSTLESDADKMTAMLSLDHNGAPMIRGLLKEHLLKDTVFGSSMDSDWKPGAWEELIDGLLKKMADEQRKAVLLTPDKRGKTFFTAYNLFTFPGNTKQLYSYLPEPFRTDTFLKNVLEQPEGILATLVQIYTFQDQLLGLFTEETLQDIEEPITDLSVLQALARIYPQLRVPIAARQILETQKQVQNTERAFYKRMVEHNAIGHSAEDRSLTLASNAWFENKIKPHFKKEFMEYNETGKKGVKGKSELEAIEVQIRKTILQQIKKTASADVKKFIDENEKLLSEGEPKILDEARKLFNSNDEVAHLAWRCYDKGAPVGGSFGNYFVEPDDRANKNVYTGIRAALSTEKDKDAFTAGRASDIIRERAAYYYLVATDPDPKVPHQEDRIVDFITYVSENRRTYSQRNEEVDMPNCFPGHISRLACIGNKHPIAKIPPGAKKIISDVMKDIVIRTFRDKITQFKKDGKEKEALELYNALVYLSDANAAQIARGNVNEVVGLAEPYTNELLKIRANFRSSFPKDREIIDSINKKLTAELGRELEDHEYIYLQSAFENLGGGGLAADLTQEYQSIIKTAPAAQKEERAKKEKAEPLKNPFPLTEIDQIIKMPLPEAAKTKRLDKIWKSHMLFNACLAKLPKNQKAHIHEFTKEFVEEIYASLETDPAKQVAEALNTLKERAEDKEAPNPKRLPLIAALSQKNQQAMLAKLVKEIPPYKAPIISQFGATMETKDAKKEKEEKSAKDKQRPDYK